MTIPFRYQASARRGNILVLSAFLVVFVFAILAFSVDMGMAYVDRTEMQRTADSAAIAAANELLDQQLINPMGTQAESAARQTAMRFAALNSIGSSSISTQVAEGDIEIGVLSDRNNPASPILSGMGGVSDSVRVRIKRTAELNGETPFFFASVLGQHSVAQEVQATAAYVSSFRGFAVSPNGGNLEMLPIALDSDTWKDLQTKLTTDDWTWNAKTKTISPGPDGIFEANLFPQDTGMPANRGTIDIGHSGNSTADIKRQITDGINADDLSYHGGKLELDSNGELILNGDTGISAGIKSQLTTIKGEPRIIPIFEHAAGNGNNAYYTITKFVGVRIMEIDFSGSSNPGGGGKNKAQGNSKAGNKETGYGMNGNSGKRLIVQPAAVRTRNGIPVGDSDVEPSSYFIYSPAVLAD